MIQLALTFLNFFSGPLVFAAPEVLPGCQGEGCSCFQEYRATNRGGALGNSEIRTIRPFSLYSERSKKSKLLGKFDIGISAQPLKQELVIQEKGEYQVELVKDKKLTLSPGEKVDTLTYIGEGFSKAKYKGKWIEFDDEKLRLKELKKTKIEEWLAVKVKGLSGFTQDSPFEMCLE